MLEFQAIIFVFDSESLIMSEVNIKTLIEQGIPDSQVFIDGEGCSASVVVVSDAFEGKSMLQQQKMVYATLGDNIVNGTIHALTIKAYTVAQWEAAAK